MFVYVWPFVPHSIYLARFYLSLCYMIRIGHGGGGGGGGGCQKYISRAAAQRLDRHRRTHLFHAIIVLIFRAGVMDSIEDRFIGRQNGPK